MSDYAASPPDLLIAIYLGQRIYFTVALDLTRFYGEVQLDWLLASIQRPLKPIWPANTLDPDSIFDLATAQPFFRSNDLNFCLSVMYPTTLFLTCTAVPKKGSKT